MRERVKKIVAIVLCAVLAFGWSTLGAAAEEPSSVIHVTMTGRYLEARARKLLDAINAEREKAGLDALVMTASLEDIAKQRAAETMILREHQRPNGTSFETLAEEAGITYEAIDETNTYSEPGSATLEEVGMIEDVSSSMALLMESETSKGKILNAAFTHVGIGCFTWNDRMSNVVYLMANPSDTREAPEEGTNDIETTVAVAVDTSVFMGGALDFLQKEETVNPGTELDVDVVGRFGTDPMTVDPSDISYSSSSDAVTVQDNKILIGADASGEISLTATAGNYTAVKKLTVTDEPVMQAEESPKTGDDSQMLLFAVSFVSAAVILVLAGCAAADRKRKKESR